MKIAAISDVHVKIAGDKAEELLLAFFRNPNVQECDAIFLLGDIFDLMIGPLSQYFVRFQAYFDELKKLLSQGKHIYYVEGNHDFHIHNLYQKFFMVNSQLDKNLFHMAPLFEINDAGKKMIFCHGDDIELGNPGYKLFKSLVTSPPLKFYANNLMPHFLIKSIGEYSSEKSRKRNNKRYSLEADLTPVRDNFRKSAEVFYKLQKFDLLVCGHSHVKDDFKSEIGFQYINNGYAQNSKTYVSIENGNASFKDIF